MSWSLIFHHPPIVHKDVDYIKSNICTISLVVKSVAPRITAVNRDFQTRHLFEDVWIDDTRECCSVGGSPRSQGANTSRALFDYEERVRTSVRMVPNWYLGIDVRIEHYRRLLADLSIDAKDIAYMVRTVGTSIAIVKDQFSVSLMMEPRS